MRAPLRHFHPLSQQVPKQVDASTLYSSAALFKSLIASSVRAAGSSDAALLDFYGGAAQVAGIIVAFIVLYARRLRPAARTWLHASWQVMRALVNASLPVVPSMGATILMIYNAVFIALAYWRGGSSFHERLLACSSPGPLLWSPLVEEIIFRGAIFWVPCIVLAVMQTLPC